MHSHTHAHMHARTHTHTHTHTMHIHTRTHTQTSNILLLCVLAMWQTCWCWSYTLLDHSFSVWLDARHYWVSVWHLLMQLGQWVACSTVQWPNYRSLPLNGSHRRNAIIPLSHVRHFKIGSLMGWYMAAAIELQSSHRLPPAPHPQKHRLIIRLYSCSLFRCRVIANCSAHLPRSPPSQWVWCLRTTPCRVSVVTGRG